MLKSLPILALAASFSFAAGIPAGPVSGNYIEARTADVYTGACFANGEADLVGQEAVFGWKINKGTWRGVDLAGLSVVGVVRAEHTLGLLTEPNNPAKAVLIVDSKANTVQRQALQSFARHMGGELMKDVVAVDYAPIQFEVTGSNIHGGAAKLTAGSLAAIQTRAMTAADHVCGNEEVWYPPLNEMDHSMPAYTLENSYQGDSLGEKWNNRLKRSGFLGTFQVQGD
jgi:hypothetical protein